jgi:hypothetical protein
VSRVVIRAPVDDTSFDVDIGPFQKSNGAQATTAAFGDYKRETQERVHAPRNVQQRGVDIVRHHRAGRILLLRELDTAEGIFRK